MLHLCCSISHFLGVPVLPFAHKMALWPYGSESIIDGCLLKKQQKYSNVVKTAYSFDQCVKNESRNMILIKFGQFSCTKVSHFAIVGGGSKHLLRAKIIIYTFLYWSLAQYNGQAGKKQPLVSNNRDRERSSGLTG